MQSTIATIRSSKTAGIEAIPVTIECEVFPSQLGIQLVGLADASVKESLLRTVTALQANGFRIPGKKLTINISPADIRKGGSAYDLPIALSIIAASGQDEGKLKGLGDWLVAGELGLDGSVRSVPGCVQAVETAIASSLNGVIIPEANAAEVTDLFSLEDIPVFGVNSLTEAISVISGDTGIPDIWETGEHKQVPDSKSDTVWDRITGNDGAKRALEIAAAGGHHVLLVGAPGSGKRELAAAFREILPPMDREEILSVAKVWSAAGKGAELTTKCIHERPFRRPHTTASLCALLGGGTGDNILPGEVSLASEGVLCIDEIAELPKFVMEALRASLEDRKVTISRLKSKVSFPARFQLVATSCPCPCGYYGEGDRCTCTAGQRAAYLSRLSGPVYDRIGIQAFVRPGEADGAANPVPEDRTAEAVSRRVALAREVQHRRLGKGRLNADMTVDEIARYCETDAFNADAAPFVDRLFTTLGLSVRSYRSLLLAARTIADLEGSEEITRTHLTEAASYRFLDRITIPDEDHADKNIVGKTGNYRQYQR